jgi:hypothetical protein
MTPRPPQSVVRSAAELSELWQQLMGDGGFSKASLWVVFFDEDDRMQPVIMPIEPLPPEPDAAFLRTLSRVLGDLADAGAVASVALLLSRDGPATMTESDRRWARALHAELRDALGRWPVHLATRNRIQVLALDDLIAA